MAYTKQTWADGESGGTPITAARLAHIEDGIEAASLGGGGGGAVITDDYIYLMSAPPDPVAATSGFLFPDPSLAVQAASGGSLTWGTDALTFVNDGVYSVALCSKWVIGDGETGARTAAANVTGLGAGGGIETVVTLASLTHSSYVNGTFAGGADDDRAVNQYSRTFGYVKGGTTISFQVHNGDPALPSRLESVIVLAARLF
jgi:hypothetical protein